MRKLVGTAYLDGGRYMKKTKMNVFAQKTISSMHDCTLLESQYRTDAYENSLAQSSLRHNIAHKYIICYIKFIDVDLWCLHRITTRACHIPT